MTDVVPVILCGGSGTRLWPLSRKGFPKQFLCLLGEQSLFQSTVQRVTDLNNNGFTVGPAIVVTGEEHRFLTSEQLAELDIEFGDIILEPQGKNTAPALTLAALAAEQKGVDPVLFVTPADHAISDLAAFKKTASKAVSAAAQGDVVLLGVTPSNPETGYGYIKVSSAEADVFSVDEFVEKPSAELAAQYLADGSYYWNSGVFVLRASTWLKALKQLRPEMHDNVASSWAKRAEEGRFVRPSGPEFSQVTGESIDYAVMESCTDTDYMLKLVKFSGDWSDLGAWDAVWKASPKSAHGNVFKGDVVATKSCNNLVHASHRLVSLVGVNDLTVIETPDAVLVAHSKHGQSVKEIVAKIEEDGREEAQLHRKVYRPWGWYDSIDEGERFKVKRISVYPKSSLSLQKHHHRAEHWIVVSGTAEITVGEEIFTLNENQSTYIPLGEIHRLTNPGIIPLEIIEVQSGSYLGEDDIVRLKDIYGRS